MSSRRPLASAMQNYHLMDVDASTSQTSLNIPEDNGRKYRAERPGFLGINLRILFAVISIVFFILALILFIGTIVAYYNRPTSELLQQDGNNTGTSGTKSSIPQTNTGDQSVTTSNPIDNGDSPAGLAQWSMTQVNDQHTVPNVVVFSDEFNSFNTSLWTHFKEDTDSHFYFHVENRSNSYVDGGILYLKPTFTVDRFGEDYVRNGSLFRGKFPTETCATNPNPSFCWQGKGVPPIMAPIIMTKNAFKFKYGKLQIRAKMPSGDWIEPIISLQPDSNIYGDGDLRSGQIHFVDTRGNRKLFDMENTTNIGTEQNCPDIRFGTKDRKQIITYCLNTEEDKGFDRDFHLYELEWTPSLITLRIDGDGVITAPFPRPSMYKFWSKGSRIPNPWGLHASNSIMAPFDQNFYLVMGISVGGVTDFFHEDYINRPYPKPWKNDDPNAAKAFWDAKNLWEPTWRNDGSALQIDFIRIWSVNETMSA